MQKIIAKILKEKPECRKLFLQYYSYPNNISRYEAMKNEIMANIFSGSRVLDAGCGYNAAAISEFSDLIGEAVGVDLTREFKTRPNIKTYTADLEKLPFDNDYFDLIISTSTCEHLKNPSKVFKELARVLKSGGKIIFTTPNKYCFTCLISSFLPTSFKGFLLKKMFGEDVYDNYPTYYRCNTKHQVKKIAKENNLTVEKTLVLYDSPWYLMFSVLLTKLYILFNKLIRSLKLECLCGDYLFILTKK